MAFTLNASRFEANRPQPKSAMGAKAVLAIVVVLFGLFCAYDYSSAGSGMVAEGLGSAQRSFQAFVRTFRLKM
ncbi:MAG: hypothetical protein JWR08_626 [Enterovirga sp.]|jgi:hypothetical protein|nr:hypothetical protein [Enterovirga sp.]